MVHTMSGRREQAPIGTAGGQRRFRSVRLPRGAFEGKLTAPSVPPPMAGAAFCPRSLIHLAAGQSGSWIRDYWLRLAVCPADLALFLFPP